MLVEKYADSPDATLVAQVQQGDRGAFDALWQRHAAKIRAVAHRFARQPADVDDLIQDVCLKAYLALPRFRGESQFYSWVFRIAFNTGINFRLAKARVEYTNVDDLDSATHIGPQQICIGEERRSALESAIGCLSPVLQEALLLNTVKGMDYNSVGKLVGCPIGTVRSRISRARSAASARLDS